MKKHHYMIIAACAFSAIITIVSLLGIEPEIDGNYSGDTKVVDTFYWAKFFQCDATIVYPDGGTVVMRIPSEKIENNGEKCYALKGMTVVLNEGNFVEVK